LAGARPKLLSGGNPQIADRRPPECMEPCRHFAMQNDDVMAARQYLRILTPLKGSFFLYGVRGVGKSTWARETFPEAHIIDLVDESRYQALLANPALLGLELRTLPAHRIVVLMKSSASLPCSTKSTARSRALAGASSSWDRARAGGRPPTRTCWLGARRCG
jgi:hypothetical protein